ncbi:MAG TPA: hypothetical protein VF075_11665, partial [Pyrinomonadaceae bacterium]
MARFNSPLDHVRVASPCNADWDQMIGSDRARFCGQCSLNVYNLSSMTKEEAELLIGRTEGRLCVRYFRRRDGSVLTKDCPVGLRAVRRRMASVIRGLNAAVLTFLAGLGIHGITSIRPYNTMQGAIAVPFEVQPVVTIEPEPPPTTGTLIYTPPVLGK